MSLREEVLARDDSCCRLCGRHTAQPALHHLVFRSQGGLDVVDNLAVLGWTPGHDCHLRFAHGPNADMWRRLLQVAVRTPGVTALQVRRWGVNTRS